MSKPDIQYFDSDGTWTKPPRAVRVDVVLQAAGGGGAVYFEPRGTGAGIHGEDGEITVQSFAAAGLPPSMDVTIGKGGRPGGRDGYALIVTHLHDE